MSSKELVISSNRHETKVAILEDDQLVELYFQRANEYSLAGSIHKGRVTRVLPGMQSAFVDLGLERDAFLYVSDFFEEVEDFEPLPATPPPKERERERDRDRDRDKDREREPERERERERERPEPSPASVSSAPIVSLAERPVPPPPPAAIIAPAPPVPPPPQIRQDDNDRRGRRSRRRRGRGRGFPDSKYATGPSPLAPSYEDTPAEPAPEGDFPIVLPGESLAKYSRPGAGPEHENEWDASFQDGEPDAADSADPAPWLPSPDEEVAPPTVLEMAQPSLAVEPLERAVGASADTTVQHAVPEPEAEPAAPSVFVPGPEPTVAEAGATIAGEPVEAAVEAAVFSSPAGPDQETRLGDLEHGLAVVGESIGAAGPDLDEPIASIEDAFALESDAGPGVSDNDASDDDNEDADESDTASDNDIEPDVNPYDEEPGIPAEVVEEIEAAEGSAPLVASVREQQPARYSQRTSRRMRRRSRGGQPGQERTESPEWNRSENRERPARHDRHERPAERPPERPERPERQEKSSGAGSAQPSIAELLREGQEIIVQIAKEPIGQKGARITSHIALPGRYVVYMPTLEHVGVSRKIASDEERLRLKHILHSHRAGIPGGFIVRTAGEGNSEEDIAADMAFLYNLWLDIRQKAEKRPAPCLLHHDLELVQRTLRDQLTDNFKAIWVDNEDLYESVLHFLQRFQPSLMNRVKMYTRPAPVFDAFNITPELERALRPKVWLKSGGYIVINQTEALVAIDVNTGKYVGKSNRLEDTIVKTNLEAVKEIVRQIRLRDLGGIIVVDFIDMDERKNRQKVMQWLEETMRVDRAPYKILQFNDFGLVAITRKRVKQSLERTLCTPCPSCEGAGYVKSVQTVIGEILQEATKLARAIEGKEAVLRVHPDVAKTLKSHQNKCLEELEEVLGRPVMVIGDPSLHCERFDLT